MPLLEGLTITWAGISAYLSVFYAMLYLRRRSERDVLSFASIVFALFVHSVGAVLLYRARSLDEGILAQSIETVGVVLGVGILVDFVDVTCDRPPGRWRIAAYSYAAFGCLATLAGLFTGSGLPNTQHAWGFAGAPLFQLPGLSVFAWVMAAIGFGFVGYAFSVLAGDFRTNERARVVLVCSILIVVASTNDYLLAAGLLRSWPMVPHAGALVGVIMSGSLINRFVRSRDELQHKTAELVASYDRVKQASAELEHKEQLASVGELSAVIAHEVRNPLAIIKNATSNLRRHQIRNADRDVLLSILDEESDRLNRLVNELLTFASPVVPRGRAIRVREIVEHAIELAQKARAQQAGRVSFEIDLDKGPESIACDPDLLQQALVNVIENALQAMPDGGTFRVSAERVVLRSHPALALSFSDTGEGMDLDVQKKATDPFFTTRPTGTGLGLAIVDRILRAHHGEIRIDSQRGRGTTVTLTVPTDRASVVPEILSEFETKAVPA